jgi:tRNA1Val (adenine37-N6)-methyltransferase
LTKVQTDISHWGTLRFKQHRRGYRFAIDAPLLAQFAAPRPHQRIIDLGCGCGIIALILAFRHPTCAVLGIDIQPDLVALARANAQHNRLATQVRFWRQDMRTLYPQSTDGPVDLAVINPPFRPLNTGRMTPDAEQAVAKHEVALTLVDLVAVARRLLSTTGRLALIYPAERLTDVIRAMCAGGIEPKRMQVVYPHADGEAKRVMIEGAKNGRVGIKIKPPVIMHQADGSFTPAMETILNRTKAQR